MRPGDSGPGAGLEELADIPPRARDLTRLRCGCAPQPRYAAAHGVGCRGPQGDNWEKGDRGTHDAGMETTMVSGDEGRKIEQRMVVEYGVTLDGVWLPLAMLRRLTAHGPWDPPFTEATTDQERVLLLHALAERHNRAGLHRGMGLTDFLDAIPYEPTVSFAKMPAEEKDRGQRGEKPAG